VRDTGKGKLEGIGPSTKLHLRDPNNQKKRLSPLQGNKESNRRILSGGGKPKKKYEKMKKRVHVTPREGWPLRKKKGEQNKGERRFWKSRD